MKNKLLIDFFYWMKDNGRYLTYTQQTDYIIDILTNWPKTAPSTEFAYGSYGDIYLCVNEAIDTDYYLEISKEGEVSFGFHPKNKANQTELLSTMIDSKFDYILKAFFGAITLI